MPVEEINTIKVMPALALRGLVMFPKMMLHFDVGRKRSIEALNQAMNGNRKIFLVSQKDVIADEPKAEDLYKVGCVARIRQLIRMPDDNVRVIVEGVSRAKLNSVMSFDPYMIAEVEETADKGIHTRKLYIETVIRKVRTAFEAYSEASIAKITPDVMSVIMTNDDISYLADFITENVPVDVDDKQFILEELSPMKRMHLVIRLLEREKEILLIDADISEKVKEGIDENQREYYLREQMRVLNSELYGDDNPQQEFDEYIDKINKLNATEEVKNRLYAEVQKMSKMPQGAHEASVIEGWLDTCLELPWGEFTEDKADVKKAEKILERDHYGLQKVKRRILELISVRTLVPDVKGQILCLAGPPGVGKTSIAKAVAECLGRKYARISMGGIGDEAEIRGHRKTYIGAMPGRIISAVKTAGSANPVLLLDEIDKIGSGNARGDASAALLETLDSEQNATFKDHYIDMPFDLSHVLFITTANDLGEVSAPLLDRMEIIEISGYTREDKFNIAKKHLIKKRTAENGLKGKVTVSDDAVYSLIDDYTREAGVRKLDRSIQSLMRKCAYNIVSEDKSKLNVKAQNLTELLGPKKYHDDRLMKKDEIGVVNGLAWTSVGGELLPLEVAVVPGEGKIVLTGSLGDVMKESAQAALTFVRSKAEDYGISSDFYKKNDIHIHAPNAAIPKDGPSAGVAISVALVSALTKIPVKHDVAMTGEISLHGKSMAIGGLPEKTMAAFKNGIKTVYIPFDNVVDLEEIDPVVKAGVEIIPVEFAEEVMEKALVSSPVKEEIKAIRIAAVKKAEASIRQ